MERRKERGGGRSSTAAATIATKEEEKKSRERKGGKDAKLEKEEKGISPPFAPSFLPLKKEIPHH